MKPEMGVLLIFQANLTVFYQANPHFGGKPTSFVAVLTQDTCVCGFRPVLCQFNFNISSLPRFLKHGREIVNEFLLQPHHFLSKTFSHLRKND